MANVVLVYTFLQVDALLGPDLFSAIQSIIKAETAKYKLKSKTPKPTLTTPYIGQITPVASEPNAFDIILKPTKSEDPKPKSTIESIIKAETAKYKLKSQGAKPTLATPYLGQITPVATERVPQPTKSAVPKPKPTRYGP